MLHWIAMAELNIPDQQPAVEQVAQVGLVFSVEFVIGFSQKMDWWRRVIFPERVIIKSAAGEVNKMD